MGGGGGEVFVFASPGSSLTLVRAKGRYLSLQFKVGKGRYS